MKNLYLIALACIFSLSAFAQPILTNVYPSLGQIWTWRPFPEEFNELVGGPDQVWDFSNLDVSGYIEQGGFQSPSETEWASMFPEATLAQTLSTNTAINFFSILDNDLYLVGHAWDFGISTEPVTFNDTKKLLTLPFEYMDTFNDTYDYEFAMGSRWGEATVTADGYGTLILPDVTHENVMRVYTYEEFTDISFGPPQEGVTHIYEYFMDGYSSPLFRQMQVVIDGKINFQQTDIFENIPAQIDQAMSEDAFSIHVLNGYFTINSTLNANYQLTDMSGRIVKEGNLNSGTNTILTNQLSEGLYILQCNEIMEKIYLR